MVGKKKISLIISIISILIVLLIRLTDKDIGSKNELKHFYNKTTDITDLSENEQAELTGFNPQYEGNVDVNKQVMIGSVDFSGHQEMYESFKRQSCLKENAAKSKYLIFDNTNKTVRILWEAL